MVYGQSLIRTPNYIIILLTSCSDIKQFCMVLCFFNKGCSCFWHSSQLNMDCFVLRFWFVSNKLSSEPKKSQCKLPLYVEISLLWILANTLKSPNLTYGKIQSRSWLYFTLILAPVLTLMFIQSQMRTQPMVFLAPCKGTHDSLGFWTLHCDSRFQVLVSRF